MAETPWDVIIVGQGLAGTTLAWHLRQAGWKVLILDPQDSVTSSRIAAGLITPITGKRLALSRNYNLFSLEARTFYRRIEQETGRSFFHDRVAIRLFGSDAERAKWSKRRSEPEFSEQMADPQPSPLLAAELGEAPHGGFAMKAAQLDVPIYLDASREKLDWRRATVDWERDVRFDTDGVEVQEDRARYVISCEGYDVTRNPYFQWLGFRAAKGDILTVRFQQPLPPRTLHRGIWVAPTREDDVFLVGATYEREKLDHHPTAEARKEIEDRLKALLCVPYTVEDHRAAVRPIISTNKAFAGFHPDKSRLAYFNGLGSKGSLRAPWHARKFTEVLCEGAALPEVMDIEHHV